METFFKYMVGGILVLLAIVGFLFVMSTPVSAHTLTPSECVLQAQDVGALYDLKMSGVPWGEAEKTVTKDVVLALSHGDTYIKDREDVARVLKMAAYIWQSDEPRADLQMAAWYGCLMAYNAEAL